MESRPLKIDGDFFASLPEGFVATALSLTSPRDVCRLSMVCTVFRSAAGWDAVWESFLPDGYEKVVSEAVGGSGAFAMSCSKKELYMTLCDRPLIVDGGNKSFSLEKASGKKCYMLSARDLSIVWGDTPRYWRWVLLPESRFTEVAVLVSVCWFEIRGRIRTSMLSPNTAYVACIVFKSTLEAHGFDYQPAEVSIGVSRLESQTHTVFLEPEGEQGSRYPVMPRRRMGMYNRGRIVNPIVPVVNPTPTPIVPVVNPNPNLAGNGPKQRKDGWMEIELGEYFVNEGEDRVLEMSMTEVKGGNWKGGLVIQGIEIRPKRG